MFTCYRSCRKLFKSTYTQQNTHKDPRWSRVRDTVSTQDKIKIVKTGDKLPKWQCETTGVKTARGDKNDCYFLLQYCSVHRKKGAGGMECIRPRTVIWMSTCTGGWGVIPNSQRGSLNAWGLWSTERSVQYLHLDLASNTFRIIYIGVIFLAGGGGGGRHESSSRICELNTTPKHLVEQLSPIELTPSNQGWCVPLVWNGVNQSSWHDSGLSATWRKALREQGTYSVQ